MDLKLCLNIHVFCQVKQDITGGKERLSIPVINQMDSTAIPAFEYVTSCVESQAIADMRDVTTVEVYAAITDKNCNHFVKVL